MDIKVFGAVGSVRWRQELVAYEYGQHWRMYFEILSYGLRRDRFTGTPEQAWFMYAGGSSGGRFEDHQLNIVAVQRDDGQPDNCGNPPPLPWKDWPQSKRDAAVALLNNSDWQRLITSMPFGGTLDPGDTAKAPKIVIPGQEWDNPNTPLDERRLKTVPGEYARPVVPDFDHDGDPDETDADDDNDGVIEPYDPEPRNPYVPRASSEPPPPPDDDTPPQSEGERSVSDVRQSHGDFLEKAEITLLRTAWMRLKKNTSKLPQWRMKPQ